MITYVNSGNDAKRFNTFVLAAKYSLIKKQLAINTQIDYLKSVYNSYISHYNQLQKLIKEVNDLTGESRYTKVDYSDFPAVDISASFSIKLNNVSLVPEKISFLRFKNTIENLRNNFSDLLLNIRSVYNRAMTELSPYGSMNQRTDSICEESSKASTIVGTNISTALTEGNLSKEDWSNIKEQANAARDDVEKKMKTEAVNTDESAVTEKEATEDASKATEDTFNEEQKELEKAADKARKKYNESDALVKDYGESFEDSKYYSYKEGNTKYIDPTTRETFTLTIDESSTSTTNTYTDTNGLSTTLETNGETGIYTVKKGNKVIGTYDDRQDAENAFNEAAGKDIMDGGNVIDAAKKTYEETKEKAIKVRDKSKTESDEATEAVNKHKKSGTDGSSGGI